MRLNASAPGILADRAVHDMVIASAEAIAERTGVPLISIDADDKGVTALVEGNRLVAVGLAAELRRLTGAWFSRHNPGQRLWIDPHPDDESDGPDSDWDDDSSWRGEHNPT